MTSAVARVVGAGQISTTFSPARGGLAIMTRCVNNLVLARARNRHKLRTWGTGQFFDDTFRLSLLPGSDRTRLALHLAWNIVVTRERTFVAAFLLNVTDLFAHRTFTRVAVMLCTLVMMTVGLSATDLLAFWWLCILFLATRNFNLGCPTVANHLVLLDTRVARPQVAPGHTLVVLTVQRFAAHLLTGRTVTGAALLVARVLATVTDSFALCITAELFGAQHFFGLGPALARFLNHLETGRTVASVTPGNKRKMFN